mgnify:CR=1 FL=1
MHLAEEAWALIEGHGLIADAAWPGYHRPPALVMEGYTVMAEELRESFAAQGASDVLGIGDDGHLPAALEEIGYPYWDESDNPAYQLFLG